MSHPAADLVTDKAVVVLQQRATVPFSAWLSDALRRAADSDRVLQIVTPGGSRLTRPMRMVLQPSGLGWVVRDATGSYYDGITGATLSWTGESFEVVRDGEGNGIMAEAFTSAPPEDLSSLLVLSLRTLSAGTRPAELGLAAERLIEALTGAPPAGWGTAEPLTQPWDRTELAGFWQNIAPRTTSLVLGGGAAYGTLQLSSEAGHVAEDSEIVIGFPPGEDPPLDRLGDLADELASEFTLESLFLQRDAGPPDLTVVPRWTGFAVPVGMALGAEPVRTVGQVRVFSPPGEITARVIGSQKAPGVWYPLGDGLDVQSHVRFGQLIEHLAAGAAQSSSGPPSSWTPAG